MLIEKKLYKILTLSILVIFLLTIAGYLLIKHYHLYIEKFPAFYAFFGLISTFLIIAISNILKKAGLKKKKDYYD